MTLQAIVDRANLRQLFSSLFWLMLLFAVLGQSWAVWPMTVAALGWIAVWLTLPGAARGVLYGLIAFMLGR